MQPGISAPQGLTNTQEMMPPAAGDPAQAADMAAQMAQMGQEAAPAAPAPKPPSMAPSDLKFLLAAAFNKAKLEAGQGLANYMGDPRGTVNAKEADILRIWRQRNPNIDPLYEKFVNGLSDDEIMYSMYPARRALIRYGRRTYTEQVEFAERMSRLDNDPRFADLDTPDEIDDDEDTYIPPQAHFPSQGEERFVEDIEREEESLEKDDNEEMEE